MLQPINNIQWIPVGLLTANDYNPNKVLTAEMALLKFSLLQQGWIQPILAVKGEDDKYIIVDGFHRYSLAKADIDVFNMGEGKVPVVVLELTVPERMLLTIRINRAKGSHIAIRMHEIIKALIEEHGYTMSQVCEGIGADEHEVETLVHSSIFQQKEVATKEFSKSWNVRKPEKANIRTPKAGAANV